MWFRQVEAQFAIRNPAITHAELKYSAFDRELLAIYLSIKHFRYFLEGRQFTVYTDHLLLTTAITSTADRSPRQTRQLSYIAEFTTDIRHLPGKTNVVADALSRSCAELNAVLTSPIDFKDMATCQQTDPDSIKYKDSVDTGMVLREIDIGGIKLLCDTAHGHSRPFVPAPWRKKVFNAVHGLAHLGTKPTLKAVSSEFVWPGMRKDINNWCKLCLDCHQSKVSQHTRAPLQDFKEQNCRFNHLHVDIVGPLTPSQGFTYLFTIIDRFTRWTEAIPMTDSTAPTCARALFREWIARFGVPGEITSDRGPQFTSELWDQLHHILGTKVYHTTAYHPQANGMVERFHRTMKASLMARLGENPNWTEELPVVMLGLRTAFKEDLGCSSAELVYGTHLRLPGGFFEAPGAFEHPRPIDFLASLRRAMNNLRTTPVIRHGATHPNWPTALNNCTHVFIRRDRHKPPLTRPYDGPYRVVGKSNKFYTVDLGTRLDNVSVDRLKPAPTDKSTIHPPPNAPKPRVRSSLNPEAAPFVPTTTRSGRTIKPTQRLIREH